MQEISSPPPRVWAYTAAILAGFLVAGSVRPDLLLHARSTQTAEIDALNLHRLATVPADAVHVVAIGTSRTLYALDFDATFTARLRTRGLPVVFHRITWMNARFEFLNPALEALKKHPPQMLLLESELLQFDHAAQIPILDSVLPFERYFHARLTGDPITDVNYDNNRGNDHFAAMNECTRARSIDYRQRYAIRVAAIPLNWPLREYRQRMTARMGAIKLSSPEVRNAYLGNLRALQAAGTRIVLIVLPRADWATSLMAPDMVRDNAAALEKIVRDEHFALWSPAPLPPGAFCDEGHMTPEGRELYSPWLASRLSDYLADSRE